MLRDLELTGPCAVGVACDSCINQNGLRAPHRVAPRPTLVACLWTAASFVNRCTRGSRPLLTMAEPSAWEAAIILRPVRGMTWANGYGMASLDSPAFTVIPRCSPHYLVRLWCG